MQNLAKQVEDTIPAYTKSGNAATAAAQKAGSAAKTAASVVNSYSNTAYEVVGNTKRTIQTINEELSNGTTQQKQVITSTSRQMVEASLMPFRCWVAPEIPQAMYRLPVNFWPDMLHSGSEEHI